MLKRINSEKIYFRNLDSIRFFAAFMVFLKHGISGSYMYLNIQRTFMGRFLSAISDGGEGVSIFFVLSGFLITYLILSEIELTGKFSLKNFYIRRILRIWPLYFAVVIVAFILFPSLSILFKAPINKGASIWYQLTFLANFDVMRIVEFRPGTDIVMQNITWSVAIEEQFYAFWPLIFVFLPRKLILPAILSVIAGSLVFIIYHADNWVILYFHTLSVMLYLATGALFAYLIISSTKVRTFFEKTHTLTILASFVLFLCSNMYGDFLYAIMGVFLYHVYNALLIAFIITSQSMLNHSSILELGNIRFANKWGKYTYGIYLLHPIILEIMHIIEKQFHIPIDSFFSVFASGTCSFILTLLISWLSYQYFEKKFLNLKKTFAVITRE